MSLVRNVTDVLFCEKTFDLPFPSQNDYAITTENVVDLEDGYDIEESKGSLIIEDEIEWLTTNEAAAYMRLSVGSFRNMVSDGHIPHFKLGRRNRYKRSELRNLLSSEARGRMYYDKI